MRRFPKVMACVLMPNHIHIVLASPHLSITRTQLSIELRAWARRHFPGQSVWGKPHASEPISDILHLKRRIRYVHLNPCRSHLCNDPLQWEWSTHRDLAGLTHPCWMDLDGLAKLLRIQKGMMPRALHQYISADPSTQVEGTPWVTPYCAPEVILELSSLIQAAAIATRSSKSSGLKTYQIRKLIAQSASQLKIRETQRLAKLMGVTARQFQTLKRRKPSSAEQLAVRAVLQILCDPRLREPK